MKNHVEADAPVALLRADVLSNMTAFPWGHTRAHVQAAIYVMGPGIIQLQRVPTSLTQTLLVKVVLLLRASIRYMRTVIVNVLSTLSLSLSPLISVWVLHPVAV